MRFPPGGEKNNPSILAKTRQIPKVGVLNSCEPGNRKRQKTLSLFVCFAALQRNTEI